MNDDELVNKYPRAMPSISIAPGEGKIKNMFKIMSGELKPKYVEEITNDDFIRFKGIHFNENGSSK